MSMNRNSSKKAVISKKSINKLSSMLGKASRGRKPRQARKTPRSARVTLGVVKSKRRGGSGANQGGKNYMASDGMNRSRVVTNNSVIEDTFQVRREKIANVNGTSAFTLAQSLYVNPGNTVLFPIFSQIAATYEEYRVNKLVFTFETDAYTAVSSTASAGKIILATNFDPDDAAFSGDTQMENYCGSVKGPPYAPIIQHDVMAAGRSRRRGAKGDFALNNYFVYSSGNQLAPVTGAGKFYDVGQFQTATSNNAVTTEIGELYVTYSFTMIRPKQQTPLGQNLVATKYTSTTGIDVTHQMGTTQVQAVNSNLTLTFGASLSFTIPSSGRYMICYAANGGTTLAASTPMSSSTNTTRIDNNAVLGINASATSISCWSTFDVVGPGVILLPVYTAVAAPTSAELWVIQIPGALTITNEESRLERLERLFASLTEPNIADSVRPAKFNSLGVLTVDTDDDDFKENSLSRSVVINLVDEALHKKSSSLKK